MLGIISHVNKTGFGRRKALSARAWSMGLLLTLPGVMISSTAYAVLSGPTGLITGSAPTATGTVSILMPDATTPLTSTLPTVLGRTTTPDQFTLAPLTTGLVFADADGDTPANPSLTLASPVTWVWTTPNGTPLTPAQRAQPFSTYLADGDIAKVSAMVPVDITSSTGLPMTLGTPTLFNTGVFQVKVSIPVLPTLQVNGHQFALNSGFPKTGFVGATFQLWMNGIDATENGDYTYSSDQSWVTVDTAGNVAFIGTPTSANKTATITMTDRSGVGVPAQFSFTLARWFVNGGAIMSAPAADAYCSGLGGGYATPGYGTITNGAYGVAGTRTSDGKLWPEWGEMGTYGHGWVSSSYWAIEMNGANRYDFNLFAGALGNNIPSVSFNVACSMPL
ncbi:hypothetical protein [Budvicia aquatica]|uniref:Invasin n=1 Tax=Budvicia aquatica TaxID=82979 RepID=A0A2C6CNK5_9GAMM|nr:hypothetical protein [Budvicia aquatica]PHI28249.1 hypothetical protein CRN84_02320 [Budvicia aquatica]VFS46125.1 Invasin [Budvicia aquatica]